MSLKKLHLHIGSYKTGTSSIQAAFFKGREVLKQQGFVYPGNSVNHHKLFFATQSEFSYWPRQFKGVEKTTLQTHVDSYFSLLEREFRSSYLQQVISTEYLFISKEEHIRNVIEYLKTFFDDVTVYLFVRDPVEYYRSMQQQMIKARSYITPPGRFRYGFREVIENWSKFCRLRVMEYSAGKDSCQALCESMGIAGDQLVREKQRNNASLSIEQMLLLEKIQRNIYSEQEDRFKPQLGVIQNAPASFTHRPRLKKQAVNRVRKAHWKDLQWLNHHYSINFLGGTLPEAEQQPAAGTKENEKMEIREVYQVDEQTAELYEAVCLDLLLKKIAG